MGRYVQLVLDVGGPTSLRQQQKDLYLPRGQVVGFRDDGAFPFPAALVVVWMRVLEVFVLVLQMVEVEVDRGHENRHEHDEGQREMCIRDRASSRLIIRRRKK